MSEETTALLRSIDASLKALVARQGTTATDSAPRVASDRDLDSQYGNPIVKMKDPRDWTGEPMAGRTFSECPPDYLDMVADRYEYFATRADEDGEKATNGKPASPYKRLDAARARGWAKRIRSGWKPTAGAPAWAKWKPTAGAPAWAGATSPKDDDDDVPF